MHIQRLLKWQFQHAKFNAYISLDGKWLWKFNKNLTNQRWITKSHGQKGHFSLYHFLVDWLAYTSMLPVYYFTEFYTYIAYLKKLDVKWKETTVQAFTKSILIIRSWAEVHTHSTLQKAKLVWNPGEYYCSEHYDKEM